MTYPLVGGKSEFPYQKILLRVERSLVEVRFGNNEGKILRSLSPTTAKVNSPIKDPLSRISLGGTT